LILNENLSFAKGSSDYKSAEPSGIVPCSLADKKSNQCESASGQHREHNYIEAIDHYLWTGYQEGRQAKERDLWAQGA